ncbi:uncharacterized protein F5Z01DRAFT_615027 [Emericellopsis atlantica]|uniref:FMN hydroxy acid dehydrogenase domain-containing protein n=1 Tax=Emericellopsis atlantica TaxID=2614577 RepID=A0A9P8CST5_9HYPO|nr:uncharacterized protein F5Z01DRAFT_615027 [Emericellopsis atlantica]KAG9258434.1 hypothetical protein F5Z01DRAFT_615027 [Emericellopsis atlantica]
MIKSVLATAALATGAWAARPFLNEPDTGIELALPDLAVGELPPLDAMVGLPDFDYAARNYLPVENYTYYRNGAGGEWSYRNNLEIFHQFHFRPRSMIDISKVNQTLKTTILGHEFSAPFFISPAARAGYGHPDAELNLVKAAGAQDILYMPALYATKTIEEIAAAKKEGQVVFQQLYLDSAADDEVTQALFDRTEAAGADAIVFTIDSAANGNRQRAARFDVGSAVVAYEAYSWDYLDKIRNMTDLPIILKGIGSVEDAKLAVEHKVPAIILSNHGGRQVDGAQSSLETALEIHADAPEVFEQIEVYADGGVRYGADVLKLLALGVKAVGLGRPFLYANVFGQEGVEKAIELLKTEIAYDAGNIGVPDVGKIGPEAVNWRTGFYGFGGKPQGPR